MIYVQFQIRVPYEKIPLLEEMLDDTVESMWWDETGVITGILPVDQRDHLKNFISSFIREHQLDHAEVVFSELDTTDWLEVQQEELKPIEVADFFFYPPHYSGSTCISHTISSEDGQDVASALPSIAREHCQTDKARAIEGKDGVTDCPDSPRECEICGSIPEGRTAFKIDSPHAFGSGHHETTKSCLSALSELAKNTNISKAVDVGCGSGILAMAISHLWNASVYATDCDPKSVEAARKNIRDNQLAGIEVIECNGLDHESVSEAAPFDLIVANIHSEPLKALAPSITASLSGGGIVLLSGILNDQAEDVAASYKNQGLVVTKTYESGEWTTLVLTRV